VLAGEGVFQVTAGLATFRVASPAQTPVNQVVAIRGTAQGLAIASVGYTWGATHVFLDELLVASRGIRRSTDLEVGPLGTRTSVAPVFAGPADAIGLLVGTGMGRLMQVSMEGVVVWEVAGPTNCYGIATSAFAPSHFMTVNGDYQVWRNAPTAAAHPGPRMVWSSRDHDFRGGPNLFAVAGSMIGTEAEAVVVVVGTETVGHAPVVVATTIGGRELWRRALRAPASEVQVAELLGREPLIVVLCDDGVLMLLSSDGASRGYAELPRGIYGSDGVHRRLSVAAGSEGAVDVAVWSVDRIYLCRVDARSSKR
jgi:hypothetical protein